MPASRRPPASVIRIDCSFCDVADLLRRLREVRLAGVAEQTAKAQAGQRRDLCEYLERARRVGIDSAAMEADVDLDEHVEHRAGSGHRRRPAARDLEVVDDDRESRLLQQRHDARRIGGMHRVGQPDVLNPRVGHHLGLAELRAADAGGAGVDLPARDHRALVSLAVRSQAHARVLRERLHRHDVRTEPTTIDENPGSGDGQERRHSPLLDEASAHSFKPAGCSPRLAHRLTGIRACPCRHSPGTPVRCLGRRGAR